LLWQGRRGLFGLDFVGVAVLLRGFEEVTYLYYRCERERALVVVAGEEEIDLSCGRNKKICYGLLVSEGFGSLLLL
jgi:hypothetical protein